jgi:hypothetical protein
VFNSYLELIDDPQAWGQGIDSGAHKFVDQFSKGKTITWSDRLAAIATEFENESAPCNDEENIEGESLFTYFYEKVDDFDKAHLVSYEGKYSDNPKDILIDQLKKGRFDKDQFSGAFNELGVGCACNGEHGLECLLIFTRNVVFKFPDEVADPPNFMEILDKDECQDRCRFSIYA